MPRHKSSPFNTTARSKGNSDPCDQNPSGAHHWLLEPPSVNSGGIVGGVCRDCGVSKTFPSGWNEQQWNTRLAKQQKPEEVEA